MNPWRRMPPNAEASIPIVGHVPHDGTDIPPDVRGHLVLDDPGIADEVLRVTDHLTSELFSSIATFGGVMHVNNISRLVVDPERFRDDSEEVMASKGAGAVYRTTSRGMPLRDRQFGEREREELLTRFFDPYAEAFEALVTETLARFDRCLIIDCHSFPRSPLAWELHPELERPAVCIGSDRAHTPKDLIDLLVFESERHGRRALVDVPFRGTYTPMRYWRRDARVTSVMIEIRRDTYIDERTAAPSEGFDATSELVAALVDAASRWTEVSGRGTPT